MRFKSHAPQLFFGQPSTALAATSPPPVPVRKAAAAEERWRRRLLSRPPRRTAGRRVWLPMAPQRVFCATQARAVFIWIHFHYILITSRGHVAVRVLQIRCMRQLFSPVQCFYYLCCFICTHLGAGRSWVLQTYPFVSFASFRLVSDVHCAQESSFFLGGGQFATNECSGHLYSPRAKLMRLWVWGNHCSACIFSGSSFLTVRLTRAAGGRSAFFAPAVFLARICHPSVARNKVKRHPCP